MNQPEQRKLAVKRHRHGRYEKLRDEARDEMKINNMLHSMQSIFIIQINILKPR